MASLVTESLAGTRIAKTYGLEGYLKAKAAADLRRGPAAQDEGRQRPRPARPAPRGRRRRRGGGGAGADRLADHLGRQHGRRFHRLRHRADPRGAADPGARQPQRHRAGGGGRAAADLRGHGRDAADHSTPGRRPLAVAGGEVRLRAVVFFPTRADAAGPRRRRPRAPRRGARRRSSAAPAPASRRCSPSCRASTT